MQPHPVGRRYNPGLSPDVLHANGCYRPDWKDARQLCYSSSLGCCKLFFGMLFHGLKAIDISIQIMSTAKADSCKELISPLPWHYRFPRLHFSN